MKIWGNLPIDFYFDSKLQNNCIFVGYNMFAISSKYDTFENVGMLVEHDFE